MRCIRLVFLGVCVATVVATADNLVLNSGFEDPDEEGFAANWIRHSGYTGESQVVRDATAAHRGSNCLRLKSPGKRPVGVYQARRLLVGDSRDLAVSLRARGEGKIHAMAYCYGLRGGRVALGAVMRDFEVHSDAWRSYDGVIAAPATRATAAGEVRAVEEICLGLHVTGGPVWVDEVVVSWANGNQPATRAAQAWSDDAAPDDASFVRIPRCRKAPAIDGTMAPEEWAHAAGVTGFLGLDGSPSVEQPVVHLCYDETKLYVAFWSLHDGQIVQEEKPGRDLKIGYGKNRNTDAIEIWLVPGGETWFQFYGLPAGGFMDLNKDQSFQWNGAWDYASTVKDVSETLGGVVTANRCEWVAEVSVPFEALGVPTPKPGDVWRLNFCRDLSCPADRGRTSAEYTTWSDLRGGAGSFKSPDRFGYARFGEATPAVRITGFGDLENGLMRVRGSVRGAPGDAVGVGATVTLRGEGGEGKTVLEKRSAFSFAAAASDRISVQEPIKVAAATDMQLTVTGWDEKNERLLARMSLPFTCRASFRVSPVLVYRKGFVDVQIDAARVPDLPETFRVEVGIPEAGMSKAVELSLAEPAATVRLDISELKPGDYTVRGTLVDPAGKHPAASSEPLPIPERPEWLDNTIGVSDEVPPPWTPVEVRDRSVSVTQREYRLADSGWPEQIRSLDREILTGPVSLEAVVDGKPVSWVFEPLRQTARGQGEVEWTVSGKGGPLRLEGRLRVEFDGFALHRFAITPDRPVALTSLAIEVPLRRDTALYALTRRVKPPEKYCWVSLYENTFKSARKVDMGEKDLWIYSPRWEWSDVFFNEVLVSDDRRGFSLMCETDRNVHGSKYAEFVPQGDTMLLRVHLVGEPLRIEKPLDYAYAYQALPLKPEPDSKTWHAVSHYDFSKPEYLRRAYVACLYVLLSHYSYPSLGNPQAFAFHRKNLDAFGVKFVPDFYLSAAGAESPEFRLFGPEWETIPRGGWTARNGTARYTSHRSSYPQFVMHTVRKLVEAIGFDGVYLDISGPMASTNPYHDSGYEDANGERCAEVSTFATRELYKRLYTYLHTGGRDGVIYSHQIWQAAHAGFIDVGTLGEEWCVERERQYKRLSPDMFRAKVMLTQYGTPCLFYSFHEYDWRGGRYGTPVPLEEILMMCLVHRVLPLPGDVEALDRMPPVWDLMDAWLTTSEFIPYWRSDAPAKTGSETVLASTYLKAADKRALVVASNWAYEPAEARVRLDWQRLGIAEAKAGIRDALTGEAVEHSGGEAALPLEARRCKLLLAGER